MDCTMRARGLVLVILEYLYIILVYLYCTNRFGPGKSI